MRKYWRPPPRPAREVTCEKCSIKFLTKKQGKVKYCIECKVDVYEERLKDLKARAKELRR